MGDKPEDKAGREAEGNTTYQRVTPMVTLRHDREKKTRSHELHYCIHCRVRAAAGQVMLLLLEEVLLQEEVLLLRRVWGT